MSQTILSENVLAWIAAGWQLAIVEAASVWTATMQAPYPTADPSPYTASSGRAIDAATVLANTLTLPPPALPPPDPTTMDSNIMKAVILADGSIAGQDGAEGVTLVPNGTPVPPGTRMFTMTGPNVPAAYLILCSVINGPAASYEATAIGPGDPSFRITWRRTSKTIAGANASNDGTFQLGAYGLTLGAHPSAGVYELVLDDDAGAFVATVTPSDVGLTPEVVRVDSTNFTVTLRNAAGVAVNGEFGVTVEALSIDANLGYLPVEPIFSLVIVQVALT